MAKHKPVDSCLTCRFFSQERQLNGKAYCTKDGTNKLLKKSDTGIYPLCSDWKSIKLKNYEK